MCKSCKRSTVSIHHTLTSGTCDLCQLTEVVFVMEALAPHRHSLFSTDNVTLRFLIGVLPDKTLNTQVHLQWSR